MTVRLSVDEYRALIARGAKPTKYRNIRSAATALDPGSEYRGRVYDSKAEARRAAELDRMVETGLIRSWIPQLSIPLPNSTRRMIVDFAVIHLDGKMDLQDVKGAPPTPSWLLKADILKTAYGLEIQIVRRSGR